jgi:DNA-directed RNA polymerase specialized sigma24 family protein
MNEPEKPTALGRKGRDLDAEALDALLGALAPDRELAGRKYEELRRRLISLFSWERCESADHLADETLNRLANKVIQGTAIPNLDRFAFGIARLVMQEELRRKRNRESALVELRRGALRSVTSPTQEAMERCLAELPKDRRELIEQYYGQDRVALAASLGISLNALRNRALRIREELFKCVARMRDNS